MPMAHDHESTHPIDKTEFGFVEDGQLQSSPPEGAKGQRLTLCKYADQLQHQQRPAIFGSASLGVRKGQATSRGALIGMLGRKTVWPFREQMLSRYECPGR